MNMQEIREIARLRGVKSGKLNKQDLIRAIQRQEGNFPCFATNYDGGCDQTACLWREDCLSASKKLAS